MTLMKTPRSVDLLITGKCNLRCKYCSYFSSGAEVDEDLATEEWLTFFEELNRAMVMDVCLQGGEPFMRPDFQELIEGIVRNGMRFSILSNGTLITDEMAQFLASTGRCDYVQVSIDGSVAETHDVCRGAGNFDRAVNGLKLLQKHGVSCDRKSYHSSGKCQRPGKCGSSCCSRTSAFLRSDAIQLLISVCAARTLNRSN